MTNSRKASHVVLLHGFAGSPDRNWFPWLHAELEKLGQRVSVPALPNSIHPEEASWMRVLTPLARDWGSDTVVVAHSLGAAFAVRLLQKVAQKRVAAVILVAPLFTSTVSLKPMVQFFAKPIDWKAVRSKSRRFVVMHAKNDPVVPFDHGQRYAEALGGTLKASEKGAHHTGKTFPALLEEIRTLLVTS